MFRRPGVLALWLLPAAMVAAGLFVARRSPGLPVFRVLAEDWREGTTATGAPARAGTISVLVPPGTGSAGVRAVTAHLVERYTRANGPLSGLEFYFLDTGEYIGQVYNLAVAWWRDPHTPVHQTPARWSQPGHAIEVGCRNKCDQPDGVPRPSDAEIRYFGIRTRLERGGTATPAQLAFLADMDRQMAPAERDRLLDRVAHWVNY